VGQVELGIGQMFQECAAPLRTVPKWDQLHGYSAERHCWRHPSEATFSINFAREWRSSTLRHRTISSGHIRTDSIELARLEYDTTRPAPHSANEAISEARSGHLRDSFDVAAPLCSAVDTLPPVPSSRITDQADRSWAQLEQAL